MLIATCIGSENCPAGNLRQPPQTSTTHTDQRAQISTQLPEGQTEEGEPQRKRGDNPICQSAGVPWTATEQAPETRTPGSPLGRKSAEGPAGGERTRWDRPAPPLPSCVALDTFLNLFVLYLFSRNVTVVFSKGCCEIESRKPSTEPAQSCGHGLLRSPPASLRTKALPHSRPAPARPSQTQGAWTHHRCMSQGGGPDARWGSEVEPRSAFEDKAWSLPDL